MLGSIAIEIRMFNATKKCKYFVSLAPLLPSRTQVRVEYQVPNFEMAISFELRLEYVNYAYHWNHQGIKSGKSGK